MEDQSCILFLQWALPRLGLQWRGFRKVRGLVRKRLQRRLQELSLADLEAYRDFLTRESSEWASLHRLCCISISRFYRDHRVFAALGQEILPELLSLAQVRQELVLRCWSVGCASGEEPYSLALVWHLHPGLAERKGEFVMDILGTDIDPALLRRAQEACYPFSSVKGLPAPWREQGFTLSGEDFYLLKEEFREQVRFQLNDIVEDAAPPGPFHLICCRNLAFTYFDTPHQLAALKKMRGCLCQGGALVLGRHESLPEGQEGFTPWLPGLGIFRRGSE